MSQPQDARCIGCGCTDSHACETEGFGDPCYWLEVSREHGIGVCSGCRSMLDAYRMTLNSLRRIADGTSPLLDHRKRIEARFAQWTAEIPLGLEPGILLCFSAKPEDDRLFLAHAGRPSRDSVITMLQEAIRIVSEGDGKGGFYGSKP